MIIVQFNTGYGEGTQSASRARQVICPDDAAAFDLVWGLIDHNLFIEMMDKLHPHIGLHRSGFPGTGVPRVELRHVEIKEPMLLDGTPHVTAWTKHAKAQGYFVTEFKAMRDYFKDNPGDLETLGKVIDVQSPVMKRLLLIESDLLGVVNTVGATSEFREGALRCFEKLHEHINEVESYGACDACDVCVEDTQSVE